MKRNLLTDLYIEIGRTTYKQYHLSPTDFENYDAYSEAFDELEEDIKALIFAALRINEELQKEEVAFEPHEN